MLHCDTANIDTLRSFSTLARCPRCNDLLIAPLVSEFVKGGEIRHHWSSPATNRAGITLQARCCPLCGDSRRAPWRLLRRPPQGCASAP